MEELEQSISVKIAKEAIMNINKPGSLFKPTNGFLETKVYFAGFPSKVENALIRPVMTQDYIVHHGWMPFVCNTFEKKFCWESKEVILLNIPTVTTSIEQGKILVTLEIVLRK